MPFGEFNRMPPMSRTLPSAAAAFILAAAPVSARERSADPAAPKDPAVAVSNLVLEALIETNGVPGMGAAVWRDGALVWSGSAGYRDVAGKKPVTGDTWFRLASVSKIFAVAAAAKLKEQGRLDVDKPITTVLPWLQADWAPMTTVQLAAHTSGMPHYAPADAALGDKRYGARDSVAIFRDRPLLTPPGAAYSYSSWGYTLISSIVEEVAGVPYLDYLEREVTPGLRIGRDATDSGDPDASLAYEYGPEGILEHASPRDYSYSMGGAGLGGTAPDLAIFGGRLLSGQVVSPDTFRWMTVPVPTADGKPAMHNEDFSVGFGLRNAVDPDGDAVVHHAGVTMGARSILLMYPERRIAVSVLSNAAWVSSIERTGMVFANLHKPLPADLPRVDCPTEATGYSGEFRGEAISGEARFSVQDGVCIGRIRVGGGFAKWMNDQPQKDAEWIRIIGTDLRGGLARGALVTPLGAFDLRRAAGGGYFAATSGTRNISIRFTGG